MSGSKGRRSPLVAAVVVLAALVAVLGIALVRIVASGGGERGVAADGRGAEVAGGATDTGPERDAGTGPNRLPDALDRSLTEIAGGDANLEEAARSYGAALERALSVGSGDGPGGASVAEAVAREMDAAFGCELDPETVVVLRARVEALSLTTPAREQAYVQFDEMTGGVRHDAC